MVSVTNAHANLDKCSSIKDYRSFIANTTRWIDFNESVTLAKQLQDLAILRLCELQAAKHLSGIEPDDALWIALYFYEYIRTEERGKTFSSTYLRQKIRRTGIFQAVSDAVLKGKKTIGLQALVVRKRPEASFEAVVLCHKSSFHPDVVNAAERTLAEFGNAS